jgi:hypothetical protein
MPQLDPLILSSQTIFLWLFLVGYFFFLKFILPIIAFEIKLEELVQLSMLRWFEHHIRFLSSSDKLPLKLIQWMRKVLNFLVVSSRSQKIVFGLANTHELLSLRSLFLARSNKF